MNDEPIDVRCLPYMPLQIERLRKSKAWLRCRRRPELAFYIVNLWMRAWHEAPAGSIEDDDDILADAAMCPPEKWEELRPILLEGWEQKEGRVIHRTVTELATEAAGKLRGNKKRTSAARDAREQKRQTSVTGAVTDTVTELVTDTATITVTEDVTESVTEVVTGNATSSVTEHEGKGREGKEKELPDSSSKSRGCRLPADWVLPDEWRRWAIDFGMAAGAVAMEADKFADHFRSTPGQRGVKLDWQAAWRNWIRNAVAGRRGQAGRAMGAGADGPSMAAMFARN